MTSLRFDRVTYTYPGAARPALADVSLAIEPGEFVVLAGDSGSGKSTLLRAAAGLVPHFHGGGFAGRVAVGGLDTRDHGPADVAAHAGSLFQDPETQVVMGSVRSELAFPLENRGHGAAAVARGVEEAALALGIGGLLDRPTHELSGGELQRVALGATLAARPALVLLDEPTSQLDPVAGDELLGVLRRLNEEWGTAVLCAEHRLERCLAAADRVVALKAGRVACDAAPEAFLDWTTTEAPNLQTPAARLFTTIGLKPLPIQVKDARRTLKRHGLLPTPTAPSAKPRIEGEPEAALVADGPGRSDPGNSSPKAGGRRSTPGRAWPGRASATTAESALVLKNVWQEHKNGPTTLRNLTLELKQGERVALMGRNGAGKSTLLRHAAGLERPTRGRVTASGRVALLLQHPGDYLIHDRVGDELGAAELDAAGLSGLAGRHPRDLSGGERQRLALAIVLQGADPPAVVCLDEPTRGMDRGHQARLAILLRALAARGAAVLVATHDAELVAAFAERTVLLADGAVIADGSTTAVLAGGWYFATQTARILGGAGGALDPEAGAAVLDSRRADPDHAVRPDPDHAVRPDPDPPELAVGRPDPDPSEHALAPTRPGGG